MSPKARHQAGSGVTEMNNFFCSAIIVAAGSGLRFGGKVKKQFIEIENKPILYYTLRKFQDNPYIDEIILVISSDSLEYFKEKISILYDFSKIKITLGGSSRYESVKNGLSKISKKSDIVLVHDGVRPFVSFDLIERVINVTQSKGSCIPVVKAKDTLKEVIDGKVIKTIERTNIHNVQTPQGFTKELILEAYNLEKEIVTTDDAGLLEYLGLDVYTTLGDYLNIKITTKDDLLIAETILKNSKRTHIVGE